jgi:hypothetical protein
MDIEQYRYQRFISDIAGQDVSAHGGNQRGVVKEVRDWLRPELDPRRVIIPRGDEIVTRFRSFQRALPSICERLRWDSNNLSFVDYAYTVASWIEINPVEIPQGN